jgi:ABC-type nitrate/sulfonate/bicarbonate transport system substrate-binding protein
MKQYHSTPFRPRTVASLIGASALALVLSACADTAPPADDGGPLAATINTVTMSSTATHWREFVAQSKGFFEDEGLTVNESVVKPQVTADALISGDAQISFAYTAAGVLATSAGADLEIVGSGLDKVAYSFVASPDVESVEDLKGRTIAAAAEDDVFTVVIYEILDDAGLSKDDVTFVFGSNSNDRAAALEGGAVQAALLPPPADHRLEGEGFNIIAETADYAPLMNLSSTMVSRKWAADNGAVIEAYLRAISTATDWLYEPANKDEAIEILAEATQSTTEDAAAAYADYIDEKAFNVGACVDPEATQALLDGMGELGIITNTDVDDYINDEYCP